MACNKQLVPCDPAAVSANNVLLSATPTSQSRIRTNIVLLKPLSFYVPDDDDSIPHAFMLGRYTISNEGYRSEDALISGYFSALCAVLPNLTNIAKNVMKNLGYQAVETAVPYIANRRNIMSPYIANPRSQNTKLEIIKFAQMCFLPFQNRFDRRIDAFWTDLASGVGVPTGNSVLMCQVYTMKELNAALMASQLKGELQRGITYALRDLASIRLPLSHIISEATKRAKKRRFFKPYSL